MEPEERGQEQQEASDSQLAIGIPPGIARIVGLVVREDVWEVERTVVIDGKETTETETGKIPVKPFIVQPESIGVSYGVTVGLKKFEFGRASVWRTRPCYTAEVEECYKLVSDWAGDKISQEHELLKKLGRQLRGEDESGGESNRSGS